MAMDTVSTGDLLEVNGAKIYYEVRGSGPSVLFIAGATGDGGHFRRVAEILSDEFTVVTYDRRANSRSPRPEGWESASTEEQSDDAAGLIEALGIGPVAVFGNSAGAIIGLDLVIRHPESVRGAILHEPPMTVGMSDPEEVIGTIQRVVEGGMQNGGPRGGCETFFRFVAGDEVFENLDPQLRERMLANGDLFRSRDGRIRALPAGRIGARRHGGAGAGYGGNRERSVLRRGGAVARRSHERRVGGAARRSHALLRPSATDGRDATTPA